MLVMRPGLYEYTFLPSEVINSVIDKILKKVFDVYDTENPFGEIITGIEVSRTPVHSSKSNDLRNVKPSKR